MSHSKDSLHPPWPKYLTYLPLSMGMIQPEWFYMHHFIKERAENSAQNISIPQSPPTPPVQIHFRSRKSVTWRD